MSESRLQKLNDLYDRKQEYASLVRKDRFIPHEYYSYWMHRSCDWCGRLTDEDAHLINDEYICELCDGILEEYVVNKNA